MPYSEAQIYNIALSACGSEALVSNPNERTREAALCKLWFPLVRDQIIGLAPWPSALKVYPLTLDGTRSDLAWSQKEPFPGYTYRYVVPGEVVSPYHLHSFFPFRYQNQRLHTDDSTALLYALSRVDNPALWDEQLSLAVIHYLAARIARPLTGSAEVVSENFQIAERIIEQVRIQAAEMFPQTPTETLPEWIRVRGYYANDVTRYFYQFQHLNPVTA